MKSKKRHQNPPGSGASADPELPAESGQFAAVEDKPQVYEPTPGLTPLQDRAVEAILQQPTLARAAAAVGINERTLRRWLTEPLFRDAVQAARRAAFGQAMGLVQWYASVAVAALVKVVNDPAAPANCRVTAAAVLLKVGREGIELDDLARRVEALERSMAMPQALPAPEKKAGDQDQEEES
jgi:hypothetical protein